MNTSMAFGCSSFNQPDFDTTGPPVVCIEGNIQHKIGSLYNNPSKIAEFMQCYFYQDGEVDPNNLNVGNPFFHVSAKR